MKELKKIGKKKIKTLELKYQWKQKEEIMNFRNLKTNFRFIFAGIVGIGLRHYIERLFPSKILLIVILIISVLAIITGVMGIYNEFKNRKNGDTAPENNVKPQRIKTKEEKESVERKCKQFEEVFFTYGK